MQQMRSGIPSPSNNTKSHPTDLISYKDGPTPFGGDLTPIVLDSSQINDNRFSVQPNVSHPLEKRRKSEQEISNSMREL